MSVRADDIDPEATALAGPLPHGSAAPSRRDGAIGMKGGRRTGADVDHGPPPRLDAPPPRHDLLVVKNIDRALRIADPLLMFISGLVVANIMLGERNVIEHVIVSLSASLLLSQVLKQTKVYDTPSHLFRISVLLQLSRALLFTFVAVIAVAFLMEARDYTRDWVLVWMASAAVGIAGFRLAVIIAARSALENGRLQQKIAVYGGDEKGATVLNHLLSMSDARYRVVGFYDDRSARVPDQIKGIHYLGGMEELTEAVQRGKVDEVILALPLAPVDRVDELINRLASYDVTVYFSPDPVLWQFFDRPFETIGGAPMLLALDSPIHGWGAVAKFIEDRLIAAVLLVLASPLLALAALAVRLDSGGPVFFRQPRRGWNGALFDIYKFRTMRTDMADFAGARQATRDDPRVTRVGRILRRTSIDELPQLFNVLNGDMSLVGPRPHALGTRAEGKPFEEAVAHYMRRYRVKPGITGWAQVNGWRGETDTNQKLHARVRYDIEYIENWSFWLDIYILVITPFTLIFRSKNAY